MPERIVVEVKDEAAVDGVGFGGSAKDMRPVVLVGPSGAEIEVGYVSRQNWQGGGGTWEAFLPDARSVYVRSASLHVAAIQLAVRKISNTPTLFGSEGWQT